MVKVAKILNQIGCSQKTDLRVGIVEKGINQEADIKEMEAN